MDESTSKACSKCGEVKPLDLFTADRCAKDGRRANCRECHNAQQFARWMVRRDAEREAKRAERVAASKGEAKRCRSCGEVKPILEFYKESKARDGRKSVCGACFRAARRRSPEDKARHLAALRARSTKFCSVCDTEKPRSEFNSVNKATDGLAFWCKLCQKAWHREYLDRNREKILANSRSWYEQNRERRRETARAWLRANPGYLAEANRRRRTAMAGGVVTEVDLEAIWTGFCALCGEVIDPGLRHPHPMSKSVDHIIPISRGGPHTPENVQWTHLFCNQSKGAKAP